MQLGQDILDIAARDDAGLAEVIVGQLDGDLTPREAARLALTTTPKPTAALRRLLKEPGLARTHLPTRVNADHLAPAFLEGLEARYGGTRLAAQELDGRVIEGVGAEGPGVVRDEG